MARKDITKAVKKAKKGDEQAISLLYEQTHNQIYFLVLKLLSGTEQDSLDIVQDSYIKAFSSLNTLKDDGSFISWLKSIAVNQARNFLKKQGSLVVADDDALEQVEEVAEDFIPHEYMESAEKRQIIAGIIDRLPDAQRAVILLYYYEGMTIAEIAAVMECSESTVKSRINYGKAKIKKEVEALEKKGTKIFSGAVAMPILSQILQSASEDYVIPRVASEQILVNTLSSVAATGSVAGAGTMGMGAKIMALSVGGKTAVAVSAAIVLTAGIGIPVHLHNENEKAVAAMAIIQQQEEEQARIEAAELAEKLEVERIQAECASLVEAINKATSIIRSEYENHIISSLSLAGMMDEFNKLNAFLALNDTIENDGDIKAAVQAADQLIVRLDLGDPSVVVSDLDAEARLSELRDAIGDAVEALGLEDAVCPVDRIEVASTTLSGTVGDIMSVKTTVYPTMVQKGAVLAWSSSDPAVADVDTESGEIALVGAGETTIKVIELGSGKEVTLTITVAGKTVSGTEWYTAENAQQFTSSAPAAQEGASSKPANNGIPSGGKKDESSYQSGSSTKTQGGGDVTILDPDDLEAGGGRTGWR